MFYRPTVQMKRTYYPLVARPLSVDRLSRFHFYVLFLLFNLKLKVAGCGCSVCIVCVYVCAGNMIDMETNIG